MVVRVNYFGMIAEWMAKNEEPVPIPENCTLREFQDVLVSRCSELSTISFSIAINNQMANGNPSIQPNDDISVFPPFAGG